MMKNEMVKKQETLGYWCLSRMLRMLWTEEKTRCRGLERCSCCKVTHQNHQTLTSQMYVAKQWMRWNTEISLTVWGKEDRLKSTGYVDNWHS